MKAAISIAIATFAILITYLIAYRLGEDSREEEIIKFIETNSSPQYTVSADQLAKLCNTQEETASISSATTSIFRKQHCYSYIESAAQIVQALEKIGGPKIFCGTAIDKPDVKAVARYIDEHSEMQNKTASEATLLALSSIYSCDK